MWGVHPVEQSGVLDVTIQCQLNMATRNLQEVSTNISPASLGQKGACHRGVLNPTTTPPAQHQYENITPTKVFSSCEYANDGNLSNSFTTPVARSAFQPVNANVRLTQTGNVNVSNSMWNNFPEHQYASPFLNDSGYGSPGVLNSAKDIIYSNQPCESTEKFIGNSGFDQYGVNFNSFGCEQQVSASCTFRNSFGTTFPPVPANNRVPCASEYANQTSSSNAFIDDDMKIAMKEKSVTQRIYSLKTNGYDSVEDVEEFYQSQTTLIDIERHNVLRQMAYDRTSSESINGYYNRKLLSVLESVEQKLSGIEQRKSKCGKQSQKRSRLLPKAAVKILEEWYQENLSNPYPSREVTLSMASEGGISVEQIRKWFANKRNRSRNSKLKACDANE